jgi:hypothetical protein
LPGRESFFLRTAHLRSAEARTSCVRAHVPARRPEPPARRASSSGAERRFCRLKAPHLLAKVCLGCGTWGAPQVLRLAPEQDKGPRTGGHQNRLCGARRKQMLVSPDASVKEWRALDRAAGSAVSFVYEVDNPG